jgi:hypothetical protein
VVVSAPQADHQERRSPFITCAGSPVVIILVDLVGEEGVQRRRHGQVEVAPTLPTTVTQGGGQRPSGIGYRLSAINYRLPAIGHRPSAVSHRPPAINNRLVPINNRLDSPATTP